MSQDLDLLQGTWTITALEADGVAVPEAMLGAARIVIEGSRFTSSGMGEVYQGTLRLDNTGSPARIDMEFDAGPEKGNTNLGIYQMDGDSWRLCLATRGTVRPASFVSTPGSGFALETLVRETAAKRRVSKKQTATPAPAGSPTEFEGEWKLVSGVMDGKEMEASTVQWVKRVTHGNQTTVLAGPQTMLKVEFTFDPSQSPQSIDYISLAGPNKGKTQLGIYKREGDLLTFCVAPPGAERPANFVSVAGDGRTLTAWKRG
jgi:uncharacterized protein (TIGR03067 family)